MAGPRLLSSNRLRSGARLLGALSLSMLTATTSFSAAAHSAAAQDDDAGRADLIGTFSHPGSQAKPMARTWWPDAGAGASADGLALVAKQVNDLAAGGFAGIEVAFLSDNTPLASNMSIQAVNHWC